MKISCCLLLLGLIKLTHAAYPSTYPFETEGFQPEKLPASTPSFTFDKDDDGGYVYHFVYRSEATITEEDLPWCQSYSGTNMYLLSFVFEVPPALDLLTWNCSAKDLVFSKNDFTGKIGAQTVCADGSCCADLMGLPKFSEDQLTLHTLWNDRTEAGLCGDVPENLYCILVSGDAQLNCIDYTVSPTDRLTTFQCYDNTVIFYFSCPVYKTTFSLRYVSDPPKYLDQLSIDQLVVHEGVTFLGDKICYPYSYYNPNAAADVPYTWMQTPGSGGAFAAVTLSLALVIF